MEKKDRSTKSTTAPPKSTYGRIKEKEAANPAASPPPAENIYNEDTLQAISKKVLPRLIETTYSKVLPRVIEALGIFVALFTFTSVEIQVFSRVSDLRSAGAFTILILFSLCTMVVLLDMLLIRQEEKNYSRVWLILLFLIPLFVSVFLLGRFSLNPINGTIEFEQAVGKRIDEKIQKIIIENNKDFYAKTEVDKFLEGIKKR